MFKKLKWLLPILCLTLLVSCASSKPATAYEHTAAAYTQASVAYEALMPVVVAARANHLVSDAQWAQVETTERTVQALSPRVHGLLLLWYNTGQQPPEMDQVIFQLSAAIADLLKIQAEAKK